MFPAFFQKVDSLSLNYYEKESIPQEGEGLFLQMIERRTGGEKEQKGMEKRGRRTGGEKEQKRIHFLSKTK